LAHENLVNSLRQGLLGLGEDAQAHPCGSYLLLVQELARWNRAYNLTGVRDPEQMITRHLLDSLSILPFVSGDRALDVGTGAGLPGLVLALARPDMHWTLLDSKSKKVRFLRHMLLTLKPGNVEVIQARVEQYRPAHTYSTIVSRALTRLDEFYRLTRHLRGENCRLLAMKGDYPARELSALPAGQVSVKKLMVPGLEAARHLVIISDPGLHGVNR